MRKACVGVVSHKPYPMPADPAYLPIWVGPHEEAPEGFAFHGDGDNIAEKNVTYCELTGLYWLWRNVDAGCKGLAHYRRILSRRPTRSLDDVLSSDEIVRALDDADVLLPPRQRYPWTTIGRHYVASKAGYAQVHRDDLDALRRAMGSLHPSFVPALDRVLEGRACHLLNIMVMGNDAFDAYCSWLFPLLEAFVELRGAREDRRRFAGNVGEFLIDAWIETEGLRYREFSLFEPEPNAVKHLTDFALRRPRSGVQGGVSS